MFRIFKKIMTPTDSSGILKDTGGPALHDSSQALGECRQKMASGDFDGAEKIAREILALSPENGEAWYHLGLLAHRRGDNAGALEMLNTAATLNPCDAETQNHYGNALRVHGRFDEALEQYRKAADLKTGYPAPFYNMGLVQVALGNQSTAELFFRKSLDVDPSFAPALNSLGLIWLDQKNYLQATKCFQSVLESNPHNLEALNNLGIALIRLKRCEEALDVCNRAISIAPVCAEVRNTHGIALRDLGHLEEAKASYRFALELNPAYPDALNNLGNALRETGQLQQAIEMFRRALEFQPTFAVAWHNLGIAHREQGELEEAVSSYRRALEIRPDYSAALNDLGGAFTAQGKLDEAVRAYRKAVEFDASFPIAYSNMLLTMQYSASYTADNIFLESTRFGELFTFPRRKDHANAPDPDRKIRIGYVSPDFRRHSVSYFLQSLFSHHSRSEVEIVCYSDVIVPDEHTNIYQAQADIWRKIVGIEDDNVAEMVTEDRIDILVDLAGHTGHRLLLFARKPAPVQVTWLGYPDTTGLSTIDYRFSDDIADPPGRSDFFHTERVCRLPGGFLCYTAPVDAPDVVMPPSISSGRITFGSFNNISKITPEVVGLWCNLLDLVTGSRLIIKNHSLADTATRKRYEALILDMGISSERVELRPWVKETGSHLSVYGEIDIALDTFPYNGTTTTCEALWMGVPVVTFAGERHAGRVGASILSRVGLMDLVTESPEAYLARAQSLAMEFDRLVQIRKTLRYKMQSSSLCNGAEFAANLENAYRCFWREWCSNHIN